MRAPGVRSQCGVLTALLLMGCGDGGTECGQGTTEQDGVCVPLAGGATGCGPGTIPGEGGACIPADRPIDRRSCDGRFGPIPEGAPETVYVDGSYTGSDSDGTASRPFAAIQPAIDAAPQGGVVAIAAGQYVGDLALARPVAVEGRCAREVTLQGNVQIVTGGAALRGVTVSGGTPGVTIQNAGLFGGSTEPVEIRYALIEGNSGAGIRVENSKVQVIESEIRLTTAVTGSDDLADAGAGMSIIESDVIVTLGIIEMNQGVGIDFVDAIGTELSSKQVGSSDGIIEMNRIAFNFQTGVRVHLESRGGLPPADAPSVTITSSEIVENGLLGLETYSAVVNLYGTSVAGNGTEATSNGLAISASETRLVAAGNVITGHAAIGLYAQFGSSSIVGNTIEGNGDYGVTTVQGSCSIISNSIIGNGGGLSVTNGVAIIEMNLVALNVRTGDVYQVGILLQYLEAAVVRDNVVDDNNHAGIGVIGGQDVLIESNEVSGTVMDADFSEPTRSGHGILVQEASGVRVINNDVHDNAAAGISFDRHESTTNGVFIIEMNLIARNGLFGINVQLSDAGQVTGNGMTENAGFGLRVINSGTSSPIAVVANSARDTGVSSLGGDADGIAIVGSASDVVSNSGIDGNGRVGIVAGGSSVGTIEMNDVGIIEMNMTADILVQESPGMTLGLNNAPVVTTSASPVVAINVVPLGLGGF